MCKTPTSNKRENAKQSKMRYRKRGMREVGHPKMRDCENLPMQEMRFSENRENDKIPKMGKGVSVKIGICKKYKYGNRKQ